MPPKRKRQSQTSKTSSRPKRQRTSSRKKKQYEEEDYEEEALSPTEEITEEPESSSTSRSHRRSKRLAGRTKQAVQSEEEDSPAEEDEEAEVTTSTSTTTTEQENGEAEEKEPAEAEAVVQQVAKRKKYRGGFVDNKECEDDQLVIIGCGYNRHNELGLTPQQQQKHGKRSFHSVTKLAARQYKVKHKRAFIPSLVKDITTTQYSTIFLTEDGCVWGVGSNHNSVLGVTGTGNFTVPRLMAFSCTNPVELVYAASSYSMYYVCESGLVFHSGSTIPDIHKRYGLVPEVSRPEGSQEEYSDPKPPTQQLNFGDLIPGKIVNVAFSDQCAIILTSAGNLFELPSTGSTKEDVKKLTFEETVQDRKVEADMSTIKKMEIANNDYLVLLQNGSLYHWMSKSLLLANPTRVSTIDKENKFKDFSVAHNYSCSVVYLTETGSIYVTGGGYYVSQPTSLAPAHASKVQLPTPMIGICSSISGMNYIVIDESKNFHIVGLYHNNMQPSTSYKYQNLVDFHTHELDRIVGSSHFFLIFKHRSQRRKQRLIQMRTNLTNCYTRRLLTDVGFLFK